MGITGKYDFPGIKRLGAAAIRSALALSPWTAWFLRMPIGTTLLTELLANYLANKGLLILNLGAIVVEGELDQKQFDAAMSAAFDQIQAKGGREKLTAAERKAIDDEVIKAARKLIVIGKRS